MYSLVADGSVFYTALFTLVQSINDKVFADDLEKMQKRVSLRVDGKCVVGLYK